MRCLFCQGSLRFEEEVRAGYCAICVLNPGPAMARAAEMIRRFKGDGELKSVPESRIRTVLALPELSKLTPAAKVLLEQALEVYK